MRHFVKNTVPCRHPCVAGDEGAVTYKQEVVADSGKLWLRVTQLDGHQAWGSPIYVVGRP